MKILYVSALSSENTGKRLFLSSKVKSSVAAQKFHKLVVEGFQKNNCHIQLLTSLPVSNVSHSKMLWKSYNEEIKGMYYHYLFFLNLPFVRQICIFFGVFFYTLKWSRKAERNSSIIICDVLNVASALSARLASRLTGIKILSIVTDLQKNMGAARSDNRHEKVFPKLINLFSNSFISSFDGYVLLTESMNKIVNSKGKDYIVMEGLVDIQMKNEDHLPFDEAKKDIIYAGGIYEKYGVRKLIDAFYHVNHKNLRLHIYGPGEMEREMKVLTERDARLIYHGTVPNSIVVKHQLSATLLVNPRPTSNEFTKYSFPSKNLEYMVSGTPVLTTQMEGMPEEYKQFVYLIKDESMEGLVGVLTEISNKSIHELSEFGKRAKNFVLEQKNNVVQSDRILSLAKKLCSE